MAALLAGLSLAAPHAAADGIDLAVGGFAQLDHYGLVAEERFYTNERLRLTAAAQVEAASATGDLAAFAEVYAFAQIGAHEAVPETVVERRIGEVVVIDPTFIVRQAYVTVRTDTFDIDVGQKFVHWGKVDLLSPLDVVNRTNAATLALGDAFESPLADPMLHVTGYLNDALSVELVYVPFLAPDLVGIDELAFDLQFGAFDIEAEFENPPVPLFSQWAHSVHTALSYTSFAVDAQVTYSYFRDQVAGLRPQRASRDGYDCRGSPAAHRPRHRGAGLQPRPQPGRRHQPRHGRMGVVRRRRASSSPKTVTAHASTSRTRRSSTPCSSITPSPSARSRSRGRPASITG